MIMRLYTTSGKNCKETSRKEKKTLSTESKWYGLRSNVKAKMWAGEKSVKCDRG